MPTLILLWPKARFPTNSLILFLSFESYLFSCFTLSLYDFDYVSPASALYCIAYMIALFLELKKKVVRIRNEIIII